MFYIVIELLRFVHIFATRCLIEMGFGSKCGILNRQVICNINQDRILPTCDSFHMIVSHFYPD